MCHYPWGSFLSVWLNQLSYVICEMLFSSLLSFSLFHRVFDQQCFSFLMTSIVFPFPHTITTTHHFPSVCVGVCVWGCECECVCEYVCLKLGVWSQTVSDLTEPPVSPVTTVTVLLVAMSLCVCRICLSVCMKSGMSVFLSVWWWVKSVCLSVCVWGWVKNVWTQSLSELWG